MKQNLLHNHSHKGTETQSRADRLHVAFYLFLIAVFFLFPTCTAKAQSKSSSGIEKVFADAGLPFYLNQVSPREFSLRTLTGETQSLNALKGKVVFVNFWATWCGPCRVEMPSMEALYNKYKKDGLEILAVNVGENQQAVQAFMRSTGLSFPALLDADGSVSRSYGVQAIPTSFLIDRNGNIVSRLVGSIDWDTAKIHAALETLLN